MASRRVFRLSQLGSHISRSNLLHQTPIGSCVSHPVRIQIRAAQYYYPRGRPNYANLRHPAANLLRRWVQSKTFYYQIAGLSSAAGAFYVYNLEEVPVSGRRRFNVISPEQEMEQAKQMYAMVMQEFGGRIMHDWDPRARMVERVLNRLIPASGLEKLNWEVHVIDDPQTNAFVIPGGKVFVFSGILDICQGEDGLAAVLGHEIAHTVAHHQAERLSQTLVFISPVVFILRIAGIVMGLDIIPALFGNLLMEFGFARPGSRKQETEADYIGLMMMAQSCYNPEAAVGLWARMEKAAQGEPPQFLSTHPSSHNRQEKMIEWMPEALDKQAQSDCQATLGYAKEFRKAFDMRSW